MFSQILTLGTCGKLSLIQLGVLSWLGSTQEVQNSVGV